MVEGISGVHPRGRIQPRTPSSALALVVDTGRLPYESTQVGQGAGGERRGESGTDTQSDAGALPPSRLLPFARTGRPAGGECRPSRARQATASALTSLPKSKARARAAADAAHSRTSILFRRTCLVTFHPANGRSASVNPLPPSRACTAASCLDTARLVCTSSTLHTLPPLSCAAAANDEGTAQPAPLRTPSSPPPRQTTNPARETARLAPSACTPTLSVPAPPLRPRKAPSTLPRLRRTLPYRVPTMHAWTSRVGAGDHARCAPRIHLALPHAGRRHPHHARMDVAGPGRGSCTTFASPSRRGPQEVSALRSRHVTRAGVGITRTRRREASAPQNCTAQHARGRRLGRGGSGKNDATGAH
ncbi:hypothetical protein B0H11DRAFT_2375675 [Mycena galericulata]|nr:hypothetical protein B0H11DRAFT_2375675 [Mycena galericulata]